jgi:hypothetical protein
VLQVWKIIIKNPILINPNYENLNLTNQILKKTFTNLPAGEWITFSVDVGEKVLKVRLALDSGETGEWEFPVFAGTGGSQIVARQPVDISKFVIEQLPEAVVSKE